MLLDLPREILYLSLQFLDLKDIGNFDSAITNHLLRPLYLSLVNGMIISNYRSIFKNRDSEDIQDYCSLGWLVMRKIISFEIHLRSFHPSMIVLISNSKAHLKSLFLDTDFPDISFREIGSCPSLLEFTIRSEKSDHITFESMDQFFQLNPQLQRIKIQPDSFPQILTSISKNCPNVTHLCVSDNNDPMKDLVPELSRSGLNLISLVLDERDLTGDESIHVLLNSFPNLHYLSIAGSNTSQVRKTLILKRVAIPSLMNPDPSIQLMGLRCLSDMQVIIPECCFGIYNLNYRCLKMKMN
jgi:hypothetical protein